MYGHGRPTIKHCIMRLGLSHPRCHLLNYNLINANEVCNNLCSLKYQIFLFIYFLFIYFFYIFYFIFWGWGSGIYYNIIINLMHDYFCMTTFAVSFYRDMRHYNEISRHVFKFIEESGRFNQNDDTIAHD